MADSTLEKLESVQAAIRAIQGAAQEVVVDGKRITYADINSLYARERILLEQYKAERGLGGPAFSRGYIAR